MIFFFTLGDATMSFAAPVLMQHQLGATTMGLILASSSVIGTITDFTFARLFGEKKPRFFLRIMLSIALLFPISFLFFHSIPTFLFGMFVWGIYFEALVFSTYHTIHETVQPKDHIWAWGILSTMRNVAWVIGPLIATYLDNVDPRYPYFFAIFGFTTAIFLFIFHRSKKTKLPVKTVSARKKYKGHGFFQEFKIWMICAKAFWPLMFMQFMYEIIDSTFFSIGPTYAEQLQTQSHLGGLFLTMYTLPSLILGVLTGVFAQPFGKKRAAFISGIVAGIGLIAMSRVHSIELILVTTFFASMGMAVIYPEVAAVFEDFVSRGKRIGNDIIGLTAIMASISYVIGPVLNGYLYDHIGAQAVFGLWGTIILVFSIFALFIVKRKIHVPQTEVTHLLNAKRR